MHIQRREDEKQDEVRAAPRMHKAEPSSKIDVGRARLPAPRLFSRKAPPCASAGQLGPHLAFRLLCVEYAFLFGPGLVRRFRSSRTYRETAPDPEGTPVAAPIRAPSVSEGFHRIRDRT